PRADTYGPVSYESYIPAYFVFGWSGKWDRLPTAHATAILFDLLCILGLGLVGLRFGGARLGATLAFSWAAYPFTQYVSSSNTNDTILPAFLIWGFLSLTSSWARGIFSALASWSKFAALLVVPLWATYPDGVRVTRRRLGAFAAGFVVATVASFFVLLLEPNVLHPVRVFWDRTLSWQVDRDSPFSLCNWRQYHDRGCPDLHLSH